MGTFSGRPKFECLSKRLANGRDIGNLKINVWVKVQYVDIQVCSSRAVMPLTNSDGYKSSSGFVPS